MYYDEERGVGGFMTGLLIGAVLGVSAALLAAPQSGQLTRRKLIHAVSPGRRHARSDEDDFPQDLRAAFRAGRRRARR
jgi:gas vesicle protein